MRKPRIKPSFTEFLRNIHNMNYFDFCQLNSEQQLALEIDYENRYGRIGEWF